MHNVTNQFVTDMEAAGYEVEAYHGRAYWQGPAVRFLDDIELQEIIRATEVRVQWDSPMLYPYRQDTAWYAEHENDPYHDEDEDDEE